MSFNRTNYDRCNIDNKFRDANSVLMYQLEPSKYYNCNKCLMLGSILGGPVHSGPREQVIDIESQLFGIDRIYSKCPAHQYTPDNKIYNSKSGAPGDNQPQNNPLKTCYFINHPKPNFTGISLNFPTCQELRNISKKNF